MSEMTYEQGGGIPRWVTATVLFAMVAALAVVIPKQVGAHHLSAPETLKVAARLSPTAPKLAWTHANPGVIQGYILQRSRNRDFTSDVIEFRIARNTYDYVDETQGYGLTFYYRVAAYVGTDRSGFSPTVVAGNGRAKRPSKPATPDDLTLVQDQGGLRVSWRNPATNEIGVWVERSGDNGATWEFRASLSLNSTSYVDTDPPAASPLYRVWTFNAGGLSPSYSIQFVGANAPSTLPSLGGINPSIPNVGSLVPSTLPSLPSVGSLVPSTLPTLIPSGGLIPSTLPVSPSVPTIDPSIIPNPFTMIPSIDPSTLIPSIPIPDVNKMGIWIGVRPAGVPTYLISQWFFPANCVGFGTCPPPPEPFCAPLFLLPTLEYCYHVDLDGTS